MDTFHVVINWVGLGINGIGALITIWGILIALVDFIRKEIGRSKNRIDANETIRLTLGSYLILALEFYIASDIIKTVGLRPGKGWASWAPSSSSGPCSASSSRGT